MASGTSAASNYTAWLSLSLCPLAIRLFIHRSTKVDFSQEFIVAFFLLLASPNIVGLISSLGGSVETFKATCSWDSKTRCDPEAPRIPVSGTEVQLCTLNRNAVALFWLAWCRLVACLSLHHSTMLEQCWLVCLVLHRPSRALFTIHASRRSQARIGEKISLIISLCSEVTFEKHYRRSTTRDSVGISGGFC